MEKRLKTLLVDGNSLFKNSFEATYKSNPYIGAIFTFLLRIRYQLDTGNYNRLRIAFDGEHKGVLRRLVYPDYKKSRIAKGNPTEEELQKINSFKNQKTKLKSYLDHFCFWYEDVRVEADDIIATYVFNKEPNEKITIMTGDVDIMQLIGDKVEILYLNKTFKTKTPTVKAYEKKPNRKNIIITHKNFKKYFGFPPQNITTIKTICGDDSDDISNISRVKEASLLNAIPELKETPLSIKEVLNICYNRVEEDNLNGRIKTTIKNIIDRKTSGVQGKRILEINERLVDLSNQEFISQRCIDNIKKNGFLSKDKFKSNNPIGLAKKMQEDGIYDMISAKYKNLKLFFKPFKKTLQ